MQVEMQVTRGLLADVTSSATTLQAAVDKASAKIAQMATFGGLSATVVQWSWLLLVILILYQLSPRIAGFATAGIGNCPTTDLLSYLFRPVNLKADPVYFRHIHITLFLWNPLTV